MVSPLDRVDPVKLARTAEMVRTSRSIEMPAMPHFNSSPCEEHRHLIDPDPLCRQCGIKLRRHQNVAIMWLWLVRKGLIADPTGSGKTHVVTGLFAVLSQTGELGGVSRGQALLICEPSATRQWQRELHRTTPGLITELAEGDRAQRSERYAAPWDVLITGHQMLLRDVEILQRLGISTVVVDDVDPLRHMETKTAWAIKKIGHDNVRCNRVAVLNATPLQKRLLELYDTLSHVGGARVLGPRSKFERRYLVKEPVTIYTPGGKKRVLQQVTGHRHLAEFKSLIDPLVLRRTLDEIDDVELPTLVPEEVWLDLYPAQRAKYQELQQGVLTIMAESGPLTKHATALTKLLYGSQICEGLSSLGEDDGPGTSVKFDWLLNRITGDWSGETDADPGEKVVVFVQFKDGLRSLVRRFNDAGIGHEVVWGEERRGNVRDAALERFREDPRSRVLIGTSAIEKSLNLQVARHLVNVDQLPNPARMIQLSGRIRRQGSAFRTVYVHNLLTTDTHEERTLSMLRAEAALSGAVWGEQDVLFRSITPVQLLQLIAPAQAPRVPAVRRVAS